MPPAVSVQDEVDVVEGFLFGITQGDLEAVRVCLDRDVSWSVAGQGPRGGTYEGRGTVLRFIVDSWHMARLAVRTELMGVRPREGGATATWVLILPDGARIREDFHFEVCDACICGIRTTSSDAEAMDRLWAGYFR